MNLPIMKEPRQARWSSRICAPRRFTDLHPTRDACQRRASPSPRAAYVLARLRERDPAARSYSWGTSTTCPVPTPSITTTHSSSPADENTSCGESIDT